MPDFTTPVHEFNPNHEPAGSAVGGQFASAKGGGKLGRPAAPNLKVQQEAAVYNAQYGRPPIKHGYVDVDQARGGRIADVYEALPVDDRKNPAVARAYAALSEEIQVQWDYAQQQGMSFEPWARDGQPYQTSAEMAEDVARNRHLYFYQGGEPHPLLASPDASGLTLNDKFRAIHDYYGHAAGGYGFGPRGEENAWLTHSQMFSLDARRAMTTETRGQNSWVNFGRHNYDAAGNYRNVPPADRPFAVQKVAILPEEFILTQGERSTREQHAPTMRKPAKLRDEDELTYRRPPKPAAAAKKKERPEGVVR